MNRKSIVLALIAVFAVSSVAFATVKEFKKISVDVPAGWTATEEDSTVSLVADDSSAALTITVEDNDGTEMEVIAKAFADQLKGTDPVFEDDIYVFSFQNANDVECNVIINGDEDMYVMLVLIGEHDDMETIMDSLEFN